MEEQPPSTSIGQPAAPIPPTARPAHAENGETADRLPLTHQEWTAFAALPPAERAEAYIRAQRAMTAVVAALAVAAPVAVAILAMPSIRAHGRRPTAVARLCGRWARPGRVRERSSSLPATARPAPQRRRSPA